MKIIEKLVNESHLDEVYNLIQIGKTLIGLDIEDVKSILDGKEGILYEASKDEGVENGVFMKEFFDILKKMEMVQNCTGLLFNIVMSHDDQLVMDDMEIFSDFLHFFEEKDIVSHWGMRVDEQRSRISILTICTKDKLQ